MIMASKNKLLSGNGWSFEPANRDAAKADAVSLPPAEQKPRISLEKRPKGKTATVIANLVLSNADRKALAKELKNACGSGGTDRDDAIEIQGDQREAVRKHLAARGWRIN